MSHSCLARDERGAVMLVALFFAVFGIAMLYLAVGAGEAVLAREHLQDAADSAALAGAITNARMMNLLVLINLVMAALLAILVAIKLIEGIAIIGMGIAAGLAFFTAGASLAAVPPLKALQSSMASAYDAMKDPVFNALETLQDIGDNVADYAGYASEAVALVDIHDSGASGFAATTGDRLPVENGTYEDLCGKAGGMMVTIAFKPLSAIIPSVVTDALTGPMDALAKVLSPWFCGDGATGTPTLPQTIDTGFPARKGDEACKAAIAAKEDLTPSQVKDIQFNTAECVKADQDNKDARPDEQGDCQRSCESDGPYEQIAAHARTECDPTKEPRPTKYTYQRQDMVVTYNWDGNRWVRGTPALRTGNGVGSFLITDAPRPPCGPREANPSVAEGYGLLVHSENEPSEALPLCSTEKIPEPPEIQVIDGKEQEVQPAEVEYVRVRHVFGCVRPIETIVAVKEQTSPGESGNNSKSAKRLKGGVTLGGEEFQVRSVVFKDPQERGSARLVRLALWGNSDPENPVGRLGKLGGFALAQSEYFYDGETANGDDSWMWNMFWRARITRFALPEDYEDKGRLYMKCGLFGGEKCPQVLGVVEGWNELLVH